MIKRILFIFTAISFLFLGQIEQVFAQDPQFTQFYANPLYLNPAMAGTHRCPRLTLNYRNQWPGLSGTYVTYSASYDQHIDQISGGVGLLFFADQAGQGTLTTINASLMYSYALNINRHFSIRAGVQAHFFQKSIDWSKLTFGDMIDARYGFIYESKEARPDQTSRMGFDLSAGILGFSKKFFGGFAVHHIIEPAEGILSDDSRLPRKYTWHVGALIPFNRDPSKGSISPNVLVKLQQDFFQLNIGLYITKGPFVGGLWFRKDDSFIVLLGFHAGIFKFGYSYDITVSKLGISESAGSHEVSLGLQFACTSKKRKFRTISCPSF